MRFHFWDVSIGLQYNAFNPLVIMLQSIKELVVDLLQKK